MMVRCALWPRADGPGLLVMGTDDRQTSFSGGCEGGPGDLPVPPCLLSIALWVRASSPHHSGWRSLPALSQGGVNPKSLPQVQKSPGRPLLALAAPDQSQVVRKVGSIRK